MNFGDNKIIRIMNLGNTCYLSSALQLLLSISPIMLELINIDTTEKDPKSVQELIKGLKKLYKNHIELPDTILIWKPSAFYRAWTTDCAQFEPYQIGDCDDAFNAIVSLLENADSTSKIWKHFEKNLMMTCIRKITCNNCNNIITHQTNCLTYTIMPEQYAVINIADPINEDLETYKCDMCAKSQCKSQISINADTAKHILIRIARFRYENNRMQKNNDQIIVPFKLKIKNKNFTLQTIIDHHGNKMNGGHYTTTIITNNGQYLIDDATMYEITTDKIIISRSAYILRYDVQNEI